MIFSARRSFTSRLWPRDTRRTGGERRRSGGGRTLVAAAGERDGDCEDGRIPCDCFRDRCCGGAAEAERAERVDADRDRVDVREGFEPAGHRFCRDEGGAGEDKDDYREYPGEARRFRVADDESEQRVG